MFELSCMPMLMQRMAAVISVYNCLFDAIDIFFSVGDTAAILH